MGQKRRTVYTVIFAALLVLIISVFGLSALRTDQFNRESHKSVFAGESLFRADEAEEEGLCVRAEARTSTWSKIIDLYDEGITDNNYQAFTYDFYITNNSDDEVSEYYFKLTFDREVFLMSAWNGAMEIHQFTNGVESVDTVPDLREFKPEEHNINYVVIDGDSLIHMYAGDYIIYYPSSGENAMEVPLQPHEGTVPGIILYVPIGKDISRSSLEIYYKYHRLITSEPLFWVSVAALGVWIIALLIFCVTEAQYMKYKKLHDHDNEIIKESIETFTGFIDAKDPYTNGHSNRVAQYTRLIAEEMGYEGEELNRIYYVALLHDCGKIGVPDNILGKPGRLTADEFEIIKSHTTRGDEILSRFKSLPNVTEGARYHHERYDGKGYPEGKKGEEIPLIARMICVADSFDAMNSNRVYRKKLTREAIIEEIEKNKGTQFDPEIADILLNLIKNGDIEGI